MLGLDIHSRRLWSQPPCAAYSLPHFKLFDGCGGKGQRVLRASLPGKKMTVLGFMPGSCVLGAFPSTAAASGGFTAQDLPMIGLVAVTSIVSIVWCLRVLRRPDLSIERYWGGFGTNVTGTILSPAAGWMGLTLALAVATFIALHLDTQSKRPPSPDAAKIEKTVAALGESWKSVDAYLKEREAHAKGSFAEQKKVVELRMTIDGAKTALSGFSTDSVWPVAADKVLQDLLRKVIASEERIRLLPTPVQIPPADFYDLRKLSGELSRSVALLAKAPKAATLLDNLSVLTKFLGDLNAGRPVGDPPLDIITKVRGDLVAVIAAAHHLKVLKAYPNLLLRAEQALARLPSLFVLTKEQQELLNVLRANAMDLTNLTDTILTLPELSGHLAQLNVLLEGAPPADAIAVMEPSDAEQVEALLRDVRLALRGIETFLPNRPDGPDSRSPGPSALASNPGKGMSELVAMQRLIVMLSLASNSTLSATLPEVERASLTESIRSELSKILEEPKVEKLGSVGNFFLKFDPGRSDFAGMEDKSRTRFKEQIGQWEKRPPSVYKVDLKGFADGQSDEEKNQRLSRERVVNLFYEFCEIRNRKEIAAEFTGLAVGEKAAGSERSADERGVHVSVIESSKPGIGEVQGAARLILLPDTGGLTEAGQGFATLDVEVFFCPGDVTTSMPQGE